MFVGRVLWGLVLRSWWFGVVRGFWWREEVICGEG